MNFKIKRILLVLSVLAISLIPFWLLATNLSYQSNALYYNDNNSRIFKDYFVWNQNNLGNPNTTSLQTIWPFGTYFYATDAIGLPDKFALMLLLVASTAVAMIYCSKLIAYSFSFDKYSLATIAGTLFYVFNPYVAIQLSGSFLFFVAHCLTAPYLYLVVSGVRESRFSKLIGASILLAIIAATNLVFFFIAIALVLILLVASKDNNIINNSRLKTFSLISVHYLIAFLLIAWFLVVYFASNKYASSAVNEVLRSENFYNLDTSVSNVFRLLGDWAFFGSYKGTSYYSFSYIYKTNLAVMAASYVPLAVIVGAYVKRKKSTSMTTPRILLIALVANFIIIGGTYRSWPTSGIVQWLFDNFTVLNIFRNTYKFTSASVVLMCILLAFSFHNLQKYRIRYVLLILILIGATPIFLNLTFSKRSLIKDIPDYWYTAKSSLNKSPPGQRTLLLPDQYFSVFNWNNKSVNPPGNFESAQFKFPIVQDSCKGCGSQSSLDLIKFISTNYNSPGFVPLARQLSIDSILQRNDYLYGYYSDDTAANINQALTTNPDIKKYKSFGKLDTYKIEGSKPLVYSPKSLLISNLNDSLDALYSEVTQDTVLLDRSDLKDTQVGEGDANYFINSYVSGAELANDKIVIDTPAGEHDYYISLANSMLADPLSHELTLTNNKQAIRQTFIANSTTGADAVDLKFLPANGVSNCRQYSSSANIQIASESNSVTLTADKDIACSYLNFPMLVPNQTYNISFDEKINKGTFFGYCISFDSINCQQLSYLPSKPDWQRYTFSFTTPEQLDQGKIPLLYLYAPALNEASSVSYRNVKFSQAKQAPSPEIKNFKGIYDRFEYRIDTTGNELLLDPEFKKDKWNNKPSSCGDLSEDSKYNTIVDDRGLTLVSNDALSCTTLNEVILSDKASYVLSIDVKLGQGTNFAFCIYANSTCISKNTFTVPKGFSGTKKYVFTSNITTTNASLYLYSQNKGKSEVAYKRISLKAVVNYVVPNYKVIAKVPDFAPLGVTSYVRKNSSLAQLNLVGSTKGILVFQESFSTGWRLKINGKIVPESAHFKANYFANAWTINPNDYCITSCDNDSPEGPQLIATLEYIPQNFVNLGIAISASTLLVSFIYLAYDHKKRHGKGIYYALPGGSHAAKIGSGLLFYGKAGYHKAASAGWLHREDPGVKKHIRKK